ncbi:MAG: tRNA uridine-5-carboxymethylaminomethyl(34) synthesis GTPase MnmE [Eubacterium sp.]|nr:tRNA uridine-5-carboxymethylaminomethyl(34) synthesis GTPase MnmE [Eubacterium sp.]
MNETIAGIATASGTGSISIIRVSGPDAIETVDSIIFKKTTQNNTNNNLKKNILKNAGSHTIIHGYIGSKPDDIIDEVLIMLMKAPHSYTAEDVVEIQCHAGASAVREILNLLIEKKVRPAEPGEFTKRAFLNGRIDLTQAESVMEIINAKNKLALTTAGRHLRGDIRSKISEFRRIILDDMAYLEAALDDPEHIELRNYTDTLLSHIDPIDNEITKILNNSENGQLISEGIRTAIIGRPNVGKSSFLNMILGDDRAIVTDIPGTTRDTIEEDIRIGSYTLHLIDTAGIHETTDEVENIGVKKAISARDNSDFIICILDASKPLTDDDISLIKTCKNKPHIILLNKSDLTPVIDERSVQDAQKANDQNSIPDNKYPENLLKISSKTGKGLDELEKRLDSIITDTFFGKTDFTSSEPMITSLRQKEALTEVRTSIAAIRETISSGMPEDLLTVDLLTTYNTLGSIIGETTEDDLIDKIFSNFCLGK